MKKKLFAFAVMVVAIISVLAITAFASEDTELRNSVTYNGTEYTINRYEYEFSTLAANLNNNSLKSDLEAILDENSVVILKDKEGNLSAYPSYYVIELSGQADDAYGAYIAVSEMNYTFVNNNSGKTYERGAVVYIEFPEGMTRLRNNGVFGAKQSKGYELNVTEVVIPTTVVRMERAFYGNYSLQKVRIKDGSLLQNIGENAFCDCTALNDIELSHLTELVAIDEYAFQRCTGLYTLAMPDTVESIGNYAFDGCTNLTFASSYLPKNLTSIGEYFCSGVKKLNNTLVFPEGITIIPREAFGNATTADGGVLNLVFLGEMSGNTMINGNDYRTWAEQVIIYFANNSLSDYTGTLYAVGEDGSLTQGESQTGTFWIKPSNSAPTNFSKIASKALMLVFCKNSTPEISYMLNSDGTAITVATAYSNNGDITGNVISHTNASASHVYTTENKDCSGTGVCIICECANQNAHTQGDVELVEYKNGFASKGYKKYLCSVCTTYFLTDETVNPIFIASEKNGYSTNGTDGIAFGGYVIDTAALKLFNSTHPGNELKFGVMIVNPNYVGESFMNSSAILNAERGALQVDISETEYSSISISITGFSGDYSSLELVFALYAYTDSGEIDFIQSQHTACAKSSIVKSDATLYTVSLDSVKSATASTSEYIVPTKEEL